MSFLDNSKEGIQMMKMLTFVICVLLASVANAQDRVIALKTGDTVSEVVYQQLGSAQYWTSDQVVVLHAKSEAPYSKDVYTMSHLPVGTRVVIKSELMAKIHPVAKNQVASHQDVARPQVHRIAARKLVEVTAAAATSAASAVSGNRSHENNTYNLMDHPGTRNLAIAGLSATFGLIVLVSLGTLWIKSSIRTTDRVRPSRRQLNAANITAQLVQQPIRPDGFPKEIYLDISPDPPEPERKRPSVFFIQDPKQEDHTIDEFQSET